MSRKKTLVIILSIVVLLFIFRVQTVFTYVSSSKYCYSEILTDYIVADDGTTHAVQNNYLIIESKGVRNFIFPFVQTEYIFNENGIRTCEDFSQYEVKDQMVEIGSKVWKAISDPVGKLLTKMSDYK